MGDSFQSDYQQFLVDGCLSSLTREHPDDHSTSYPTTHSNIASTHAGVSIEMPAPGVIQLTPETWQSEVVISAGIHGNETAPIEILDLLLQRIFSGQLLVKTKLLFLIGNPHAMKMARRYCDVNLNRLFNTTQTKGEKNIEQARVATLQHCLTKFFVGTGFRIHYDLHTAIRKSVYERFALYPFRADGRWNLDQVCFLGACGINTLLLNHKPNGTFSYYSSSKFGADSLTLELGSIKPFGENDLAKFDGLISNLEKLICDEHIETAHFSNEDFRIFQVVSEVVRSVEDFELNVSPDTRNFHTLSAGTVLFSSGGSDVLVGEKDLAIVFPNTDVPIGERAGLLVEPVDLDPQTGLVRIQN